jgi:hypothetical protein
MIVKSTAATGAHCHYCTLSLLLPLPLPLLLLLLDTAVDTVDDVVVVVGVGCD